MANKTLFDRIRNRTDAVNSQESPAYAYGDKHALAQYAVTGCLNSTFYATAFDQLDKVLDLCRDLDPEFIARTAIYARQHGAMKDLPSLLCAVLSVQRPELLSEVFARTIDNGKMLRNFVQIMRSGVIGRKSLGTLPKRLVTQWLESRSDAELFAASVGNSQSLVDILKMVHPKPCDASRDALFGYLIGRTYDKDALPEIVRQFVRFKHNPMAPVPSVPFQMLTSLPLKPKHWKRIARNAPWQMTRMNLNTFQRHEVFKDRELVDIVAKRLRNVELIHKARVFPYQLMVAYANASEDLPVEVREALQDAMEIALSNVPQINGRVFVLPDVSWSMQSPITGFRLGSSSVVHCVDVAALVAAAVVRKNPQAEVIPFSDDVVRLRLNGRDSVMTNARKLSSLPAGGTNCSAPLRYLNQLKREGDLIIYVSDNQSWIDSCNHGTTETMRE